MKKGKKIFCHPKNLHTKLGPIDEEMGRRVLINSDQVFKEKRIGWNVEVSKSYKEKVLSPQCWRLLSSHRAEKRIEWD